MEVSSYRYFASKQRHFSPGNFCPLCRILQQKAPFAHSETVQNPCRNRALTLRQIKSPSPPPACRHWFERPHIKIKSYEILLFARQPTAKQFFRFSVPPSWQTALHHGSSLDPRFQWSDVLGCGINASTLRKAVPVHLPLPA